jgi:hypothetical protein
VVYDAKMIEEIIRVYAMAYSSGALRENQMHIGKRAAMLVQILVKTALHIHIEQACGLKVSVQKIIKRYYFSSLYDRANALLYPVLKMAYPERETYKYQGLMATCFDYAYKEFLGKEVLARIKEGKSKGYPIHQYIPDPVLRNRCVYYILLLANYIAAKECSVQEAKEPARELLDRLIEIKAPGMVDSAFCWSQWNQYTAEIEAIHYGEVKLGSQRIGDGYILQDGTAGLSENGLATLLGMDQRAMFMIGKNGLPKKLNDFLEADEKLEMFPVKVMASCPYKDRQINFYPVSSIELLLRAYSSAMIAGALQKNQQHIGRKSIQVQTTLIRCVLASLISEACGLGSKIQEKMEKTFRKDFFIQERHLLGSALRIQSPKLDSKKQQALVAKSFGFGYEDAFTKEEYKRLQGKAYPLHQHIENPQTRSKLSQYLFLLSGQILVQDDSLAKARIHARDLFQRIAKE